MIKIERLTKSYSTPAGRHFVFKDLTFDLPSNKSIALIGRNGAGKSTLLRMIGGVDRPDYGLISTKQTISWPVGLSGGFQGSLTGRENVKFVSRLYAEKKDLKDKIDFVADFSELGKYFDMPIKTYSSGMRSRLGFGLSMAFKFDYYLVDEVTSVGDARFKKKCLEIFNQRHRESNFIMVSHSINLLKQYCDAAVFLGRDNSVSYFDSVDNAIDEYNKNEGV
ncbi:TPA: ABC transporter ATP-binding protein [Kluyvera cryocrescens]|nr:ABC transporter ATP-binding protein [Kluyvera ascorbata]